MNGIECFILVFTLFFLFVWFGKLVNVMSLGRVYGKIFSWVSFVLGILSWAFLFGLMMISADLFGSFVVRWVSVLLIILFAFQITEIFYVYPKSLRRAVEGEQEDSFKWWKE